MILTDRNGREAEVELVVWGQDDMYLREGYYIDDAEPVSDDELNWMTAVYADKILEEMFQILIGWAEDAYEGDR